MAAADAMVECERCHHRLPAANMLMHRLRCDGSLATGAWIPRAAPSAHAGAGASRGGGTDVWVCGRCTLENPAGAEACEACDGPSPLRQRRSSSTSATLEGLDLAPRLSERPGGVHAVYTIRDPRGRTRRVVVPRSSLQTRTGAAQTSEEEEELRAEQAALATLQASLGNAALALEGMIVRDSGGSVGSSQEFRESLAGVGALMGAMGAMNVQGFGGAEGGGSQGLSAEGLTALPASTLDQADIDRLAGKGDGTCVICQSEFCAQEEAKRLPCLHTFHVECIDRWLARANTCPICVHSVE